MNKMIILFLIFSVGCSSMKTNTSSERSPAGLNDMGEILADLKKVLKLSKVQRRTEVSENEFFNVIDGIKDKWHQKFSDPAHPFFLALPQGPVRKWQDKLIEFGIDTDVFDKEAEPFFTCTIWRHENLRRTLEKDVESYRRMIPKNVRYIQGKADYILEEGDKFLGRSFLFRLKDLSEKDLNLIVDIFSNQEAQVLKNTF